MPDNQIYHYLPNPGNAGDSLIAHATFQLFEELNINYQVVDILNFNPNGKVLVYGGGGNFVTKWTFARKIIKAYHPFLKKLIILPHTINGNEDVLENLGSNVDIICREKVSFDHVKKNAVKSNIFLMDDMAFHLKVKDIMSVKPITFKNAVYLRWKYSLKKNGLKDTIPPIKMLIKKNTSLYLKNQLNRFNRQGNGLLNCFRTDKEKTGIKHPAGNLDLSKLFAYGTKNNSLTFYSSWRLLNFINQYDEIRTDRLHLCIGGAILDKRVKMYPNNYYKNEAVYHHSIKDKFPNVIWMG